MNYYKVPLAGQFYISQRFGENPVSYARFGIPGHNGIDLAASRGTPIIAPRSGVVAYVRKDIAEDMPRAEQQTNANSTGNYVELLCKTSQSNVVNSHRFLHMIPDIAVQVGQEVDTGDILGYVGTTGNSTGFHTHWDVRDYQLMTGNEKAKYPRMVLGQIYDVLNYDNNYQGVYDFYDQVGWTNEPFPLPVELRYGQPYSYARELTWSVRYNEQEVRKRAVAAGFGEEWRYMRNAFIYGFWDRNFVFSTANFAIWAYNHKPAYDLYLKTKDARHLARPYAAPIG